MEKGTVQRGRDKKFEGTGERLVLPGLGGNIGRGAVMKQFTQLPSTIRI